jgi:hypothetical protein
MRIVICYVVVELQRDFSLERVNSPLSLDTSSRCQYVFVTYCHLSLPTVNLLTPLGYGSHCREGINGNPVLTLDYFSLLERLAKSLVRSIASPLTTRGFPLAKVQAPTMGYSTAHGLQSRSRCRRSLT